MSQSVSSRRSNNSYRRVGKSNVDETLFASDHPHSISNLRSKPHRERNAGFKKNGSPKANVRLTREQLDAMKCRSIIQNTEQLAKAKAEKDRLRREKHDKAEARKTRMLKLEKERLDREASVEIQAKEELVKQQLTKADNLMLENLDQIKTMRRKKVYAQCARIREAQIEEKEEIARQKAAFEERQDLLMEIDRLKNLKAQEAQMKKRKEQRVRDAKEIRAQIQANDKKRILEEERLELEKQQMNASIKQQQEKEIAKLVLKQKSGKELLKVVLAANQEAIDVKARRKIEEKEEDQRILYWQAAKRLQEEKVEEDKRQAKLERDREFYEISNQMQRASDNRGEEDARRAKRHQQAQAKKEREAAEALKQKRRNAIVELTRARKAQGEAKEANMKALALADHEEFLKISKENAEIQSRSDEVLIKRQKEADRHQQALRKQMLQREEQKRQIALDRRMQGAIIKKDQQMFLAKLEKKKKDILQEMVDAKIPLKYQAEVQRMKCKLV